MKKKLTGILLCTALAAAMMTGCTDKGKDTTGGTDSQPEDTSSDDKTDDDTPDTASDSETGSGDDHTDTGTDNPSDEGSIIGISMPAQSLKRWSRDGAYLKEQFQAAGFETILAYSDDPKKQAEDIQNMLDDDADLLVVAAADGSALDTVMNEAASAGVPVIAYDRLIMNDAISCYVSFDNYEIGKLQGEFIIENLDLENADYEVYNMEITAGDPSDNNAAYYYQGAVDILQPYIDKGILNLVSGQIDFDTTATPDWSTDAARSRAQNLLSSYYADGTQLDVWLCSNDSIALGVAQAIASDYSGSNLVLITGQDGDEANLKNIADDIQSMTVYKNTRNEAIVTLGAAKAILAGSAIDDSLIPGFQAACTFDTESYETSEGSRCPSFLLTGDVITKDSLPSLVDTGLYTMGDDGYLSAAD